MQKSSFYNCDSSYVPKLNYKEDIQILCKGPKTKYWWLNAYVFNFQIEYRDSELKYLTCSSIVSLSD